MITRQITYAFKPMAHTCDGRCDKAWGINNRPMVEYDTDDPDDTAWKADGELPMAPANPGTYEGGDGKPSSGPVTAETARINKWCVRECERSMLLRPDQSLTVIDLSRRVYNQPWKHPEGTSGA